MKHIFKISIHICVLQVPFKLISHIFSYEQFVIYFSSQERKTALFHAVEKGHVLIVKELLDAGANTETTNKVCKQGT